MKLYQILPAILAVFLCSCEDDPANQIIEPTNNNFNGTFLLTEFNTSVHTDLNLDGIYSSNQMDETTCYDQVVWNLNRDYTFQINPHQVKIIDNGVSAECFPQPNINGSWSKAGNKITVSYNLGGNHYTEQYTLSENQDTLKTFRRGLFIVGNNDTGGFANVASDVEAVYVRQ